MKSFRIFFSCFFFVTGVSAFAQQGINASGTDAIGTGGSVSYTIGQVDYSGSNGNGVVITQGLQQPYEIFVITGIDKKNIDLTFSVYPNPTIDFLTLKIGNYKTGDFAFLLYNIEGKMLLNKRVESSETTISMKDLANAIYYIKILNNNMEMKVFKVVKNN